MVGTDVRNVIQSKMSSDICGLATLGKSIIHTALSTEPAIIPFDYLDPFALDELLIQQ